MTIPSEDRVKHKASSLLLLQEVNQPHVDVLVVFEVRVLQHYADILAPRRSHPQTFRSRPSTPSVALGVCFLPLFAVLSHSVGSLSLPDLSCDLAVGDILPQKHGVLNDHGVCIILCLAYLQDGREYGRASQSHHTLLRRKGCVKEVVELKRVRHA